MEPQRREQKDMVHYHYRTSIIGPDAKLRKVGHLVLRDGLAFAVIGVSARAAALFATEARHLDRRRIGVLLLWIVP